MARHDTEPMFDDEVTDPIVIVTPLRWRPVVMPKRGSSPAPPRPRWAEGVVLRRPR